MTTVLLSPKRSIFIGALAVSLCLHTDATSSSSKAVFPPSILPKTFYDGVLSESHDGELADVFGCCSTAAAATEEEEECTATTNNNHHANRRFSRVLIGQMPQFTTEQSLLALRSSVEAWNGGSGDWPQSSLLRRIEAVRNLINELRHVRQDIVNALMWEIGKNRIDAEAEFDRTVQFVQKLLEHIRTSDEFGVRDDTNGSTRLYTSRSAVGIVLCLGPYNYPLNETHAVLIPALLMGNVVLLKIPTTGGLAHLLTMEAFKKSFPEGVVNFISGRGRTTMPPLMETGKIDSLAFIGGSKAADDLIRSHPQPHRLKVFLQLEAKNMGVYMPDLFVKRNNHTDDDDDDNRDITMRDEERVLKETIAGTLSFNGQRCTALKLLFAPADYAEKFAQVVARKVETLTIGLPWEKSSSNSSSGSHDDGKYSQITPLPNKSRVDYMKELIRDAVSKGARIVNKDGGTVIGGEESTLMIPAVLYPVTTDMRIYEEEQFGPIIPIAEYDTLETVLKYAREGKYGQQVSIFTGADTDSDHDSVARLVDAFSTVFGKININSQCGRSPDTAPFSGRRSSAMGVMSVTEALHEFSVPTVVSYKEEGSNSDIVSGVERASTFMQPASG